MARSGRWTKAAEMLPAKAVVVVVLMMAVVAMAVSVEGEEMSSDLGFDLSRSKRSPSSDEAYLQMLASSDHPKRMSQMRLKKMSQMRLKKMSQMRLKKDGPDFKRMSQMRLRRGPSMIRLKKASPLADCLFHGLCWDQETTGGQDDLNREEDVGYFQESPQIGYFRAEDEDEE